MITSADHGPISEVGSPVLIGEDPVDHVAPWRWQTAAIALATGVLVVLNAHSLDDWATELAPNRLTQLLRGPVSGVATATRSAGLDAPRAKLHATWEGVRRARFGKEQPGEQGAAAGEE